jgi:GT2 family glycosyltransferase
MAEIAVAVVSWNTRELLDACLRSLAPAARDGIAEVWVVDNASSDGSAALVRTAHPWATLIERADNVGFGAAVNEVAGQTETQWIAAANADVELTPGALQTLLRAGREHPESGVLAPRLELPDESTQHSVRPFPTLALALLVNLGVGQAIWPLGDRLTLDGRWDPHRARRVDWAIGAFLLIRRRAWDAVGGFDERQWMYAEDLDLGWRLARAGWSTWYEPGATVRHASAAATSQAWRDQRTEQWMRSTYAWMLRRRGAARTRLYAALNVAGALARAALLTPGAVARPRRYGARRQAMLTWARLHKLGLRRRSALEHHR